LLTHCKDFFNAKRGKNVQSIQQAENLLMEDLPFAPICHWNFAFLIQPHIKGFAVSPVGHIYFDRLSLESKK